MPQPFVTLNDGSKIPQIGLGTYQAAADHTAAMVETALGIGYRHIDTAMIYRNEAGIGDGLRTSGVPREDVYITTKLWNTDQGGDSARAAFNASLDRLKLDYVDLYLIHWPVPARDLYVESWETLIELREEGRARAIGVSNFMPDQIDRLIETTGVPPVVNQIECHPAFQQVSARAENAKRKVTVQSWSPLGQGELLGNAMLKELAEKHGRTVAQIILRWHLQNDLIVIPKTVHEDRMRENLDILDFTLDADDMAKIATLDGPEGRMGPHPLTFE
jgi:2,5-diketo-D-gluconate reductase A